MVHLLFMDLMWTYQGNKILKILSLQITKVINGSKYILLQNKVFQQTAMMLLNWQIGANGKLPGADSRNLRGERM